MSGSQTPPRVKNTVRGVWGPVRYKEAGWPRKPEILFPPKTKAIIERLQAEAEAKGEDFLIPMEYMPEERYVEPANSPLKERRRRPNYTYRNANKNAKRRKTRKSRH